MTSTNLYILWIILPCIFIIIWSSWFYIIMHYKMELPHSHLFDSILERDNCSLMAVEMFQWRMEDNIERDQTPGADVYCTSVRSGYCIPLLVDFRFEFSRNRK